MSFETGKRENETSLEQERIEASYAQMQKDIELMQRGSKYERSVEDDREILTSPEGEKFTIRKITKPEDPVIEKLYPLLRTRFTEEETDTPETIRDAISTHWGAYHIIEDADGNVLTHSCVGLLDLKNPEGSPEPKEGILFVGYILNDPNFHKPDLAREIFQSVYKDTLADAKSRGIGIKGITGESVERVEPLANMAGLSRIYFENRQGDIQELPFECPPINWNYETGEPLQDPTPEHLIVKLMDDKKTMDVQEILSMVWSIYEENYVFPATVIPSPDARQNNRQAVLQFYNKLKESLDGAKDGRLFTMSLRERRKKARELQGQGKKVIEVEIPNDEE